MQEPKWCSTLFSALIINLHLSGTCINDTDLFQRDITELLNHPIGPIYNLAKQFAKLLPVFFNEIVAEGELREVSTELDETHRRKDTLTIHFLRKQSHVESSNLIVNAPQIGGSNLLSCYRALWKEDDRTGSVHRLNESFLRDLIAGTFGLQHLDNLILCSRAAGYFYIGDYLEGDRLGGWHGGEIGHRSDDFSWCWS